MSEPDPDRLRRQLANFQKSERDMLKDLTAELPDGRRREGEYVLAEIQRTIGALKGEIAKLSVSA